MDSERSRHETDSVLLTGCCQSTVLTSLRQQSVQVSKLPKLTGEGLHLLNIVCQFNVPVPAGSPPTQWCTLWQ